MRHNLVVNAIAQLEMNQGRLQVTLLESFRNGIVISSCQGLRPGKRYGSDSKAAYPQLQC
jgi:hypothetical protein